MSKKERLPGDASDAGEEVPTASTGSGADASGPVPQGGNEDELTVDDILGTEQSADAVRAEEGTAAGPGEASGEGAGEGSGEGPVPAAGSEAAGYLEDLLRITAEYANYRKRTEANVEIEKQRAKAAAVNPLLSVLDDLDRAEAHGDLEEGSAFATIAQKIRGSLERMGLSGFGEKGEVFDPQLHEAIAQLPMPGTEQPTVLDVVERGYRLGEVELRPAKVAVAVPADG